MRPDLQPPGRLQIRAPSSNVVNKYPRRTRPPSERYLPIPRQAPRNLLHLKKPQELRFDPAHELSLKVMGDLEGSKNANTSVARILKTLQYGSVAAS